MGKNRGVVVLGKAESSSKKVRTRATERGEVSEQRAEEQEGGKKKGEAPAACCGRGRPSWLCARVRGCEDLRHPSMRISEGQSRPGTQPSMASRKLTSSSDAGLTGFGDGGVGMSSHVQRIRRILVHAP